MAETNEYFNIGSIVKCVTCFNEEIQGEVLAFDHQVKMLTLKSNSSTASKVTNCDVQMVNLGFVTNVTVIKEASGSSLPTLPSLNLGKLSDRAKKTIDDKRTLLQAMQAGGTPDGQKLFHTIYKTIDDISWAGANIVVWNSVVILPPYMPENVREYKERKDSNSKSAVTHVKKIVEKHYKDQQSLGISNGTAGSPIIPEIQPISQ